LLQFADEQFEAAVIVQDLAVITVHGLADEAVRVNPSLRTARSVYDRPAPIFTLVA